MWWIYYLSNFSVPISAKLVADMLVTAGVDRVITVDIHAEQIQGFFHIVLDNVYGTPVMFNYLAGQQRNNIVVVSPDIGGIMRARAVAKHLNCDFIPFSKFRSCRFPSLTTYERNKVFD